MSDLLTVVLAVMRLLLVLGFLVASIIESFRSGDRFWIYLGISVALTKHPLS